MATESIYRLNKLNKEESEHFIEAMEEAYELSLKHPLKPRPELKVLKGEEAADWILGKADQSNE